MNELKNQKTVRVQLSRPTEDMVPEPGEAKKLRRGSHLQRAESNGQSWHAATPAAKNLLAGPRGVGGDSPSTSSSMGANGRGVGGAGGATAAEWACEVLKDHKKRRSFIHIPSRSVDLGGQGSGGGGGGGDPLADIFGEAERPSRASTAAGLTASISGSGSGGLGSRGSSLEKPAKNAPGAAGASPGADGGGAAAEAGGAGPAAGGGGNPDDGGSEELIGADSAGNDGVVVKKPDADRLELDGNPEGQPDRIPAAGKGKGAQEEGGDEARRREHGGENARRHAVAAAAAAVAGGGGGMGAGAAAPAGPSSRHDYGVDSIGVEREQGGEEEEASAVGEGGPRGERQYAGGAGGRMSTPTPLGAKVPLAAMTSTPGSKRRLVTEVIGDGDDVDVSRPQGMDDAEVSLVFCLFSLSTLCALRRC